MIMRRMLAIIGLTLFAIAPPETFAENGQDLGAYKLRIDGLWWFSHPTGNFYGKDDEGSFNVNRDFGFGNYSTFSGLVDWRFKRKHHLLFGVSPITSQKTVTLGRTIEFNGQTYDVGAVVDANIKTLSFAPGYQYDIFRRNTWYLAIATQCNLLRTSAKLSAVGTVGGQSASTTASGSFFAPLPIFGPRAEWYPVRNSDRFYLIGAAQGMYFFGYGDFVSARGGFAIKANPHLRFLGGYQMGSRLSFHGSSNQIGARLTQQGPTAGIQASW